LFVFKVNNTVISSSAGCGNLPRGSFLPVGSPENLPMGSFLSAGSPENLPRGSFLSAGSPENLPRGCFLSAGSPGNPPRGSFLVFGTPGRLSSRRDAYTASIASPSPPRLSGVLRPSVTIELMLPCSTLRPRSTAPTYFTLFT